MVGVQTRDLKLVSTSSLLQGRDARGYRNTKDIALVYIKYFRHLSTKVSHYDNISPQSVALVTRRSKHELLRLATDFTVSYNS